MRRGGGYYYRKFSRWDLGIISAGMVAGRAEAQTALLDAENVRLSTGTIVPRDGQEYIDEDIFLGDDETKVYPSIGGIYEYSRQYTGVNGIDVYRTYIFSADKGLYLWDGEGDNDIWDITAGLGIELTSDDIYCLTYLDYCYITNGYELIRTDGTASGTRLLSSNVSITAPTVALSISNIAGTFTGRRDYMYRYVKQNGGIVIAHSLFSDKQTAILSDQYAQLTYTKSPDENCTHIEIWATKFYTDPATPETKFYRLYTIENDDGNVVDNATDEYLESCYTEYIGDDFIGNINGLNKLVYYKDRIYGISSDDPSLLWYSDLGNPEKWSYTNWIDVRRDDGDYIVTCAVLGQSLYIFKNRSIWVLTGDPDAVPLMEVRTGSDVSPTQTEFGLGCTAPRSVAVISDTAYFYSKVYGVWSLSNSGIKCISTNISDQIRGLDNPVGFIYSDSNGRYYYVLADYSTGIAWVYDIELGGWVKDTNMYSRCYIINHNGEVIGGKNGRLNKYYVKGIDTDNDALIEAMIRTHWVDLQEGNTGGLLRYIMINAKDRSGFFTISAYNEEEQQPIDIFAIDSNDTSMDFNNNCFARLVSLQARWTIGELESIYIYFLRRVIR